MPEFDVVMVGSGTAGQTAAYDLKAAGLRVAVIESSDRPGGICALAGCQAKKWYYEAAETVCRSLQLKGRGIMDAATGSWSQVLMEKNKFTSGVSRRTVDGFKEAGIEYLEGSARFVSPDSLAVGGRRIRSRFFVLATGARPLKLEIPGKEHLVFSTEFMELESLPERILFVGGGFIAFEFAHFGKAEPETISYEAVPAVLFTFPQYAMVGKTEAALQKDGIAYRKSFGKNLRWPTYQRIGLGHAAYKILASADGRFLGAHFLSDNASGLVNALRLAMINGITVEQLYQQSIMSPYPTRESDLIYMLKPLLSS